MKSATSCRKGAWSRYWKAKTAAACDAKPAPQAAASTAPAAQAAPSTAAAARRSRKPPRPRRTHAARRAAASRRHRMPRRRLAPSRRLHRRIPRRRPRSTRAGRALCALGASVYQSRFHSVEGIAARSGAHESGAPAESASKSASPRSIWPTGRLSRTKCRPVQQGLAGMATAQGGPCRRGEIRLGERIAIADDDGKTQLLRFEQCIIAAGSQR